MENKIYEYTRCWGTWNEVERWIRNREVAGWEFINFVGGCEGGDYYGVFMRREWHEKCVVPVEEP